MRVSELEKTVLDYCEKEKIPIVNGSIDPKYVLQVETFIDVLKNTFKTKKRFERTEPKQINSINIMGLIGNENIQRR